MYKVVRNGFRKTSILWIYFPTEDGIRNPQILCCLIILQNKDLVKIKTVVIILNILANFIVHRNFDHIRNEKLQYDINREAAKISALL